jgi:mono/diheme cytochrome c family protein
VKQQTSTVARVRFAITALAVGILAIPAALSAADVTFTRDVAPILQQKCQSCHRPGGSGPMSLLTYEEVVPRAQRIKARVAAREMPPWHVAPDVGIQHFKNDPSLTERQVEAIVSWVDGGAPRGALEDLAPSVGDDGSQGWRIGRPDHVVEMPKDHVMPADSPDLVVDYFADVGLERDRYFKAVEVRLSKDGPRIVHRAVVELVGDRTPPRAAATGGGRTLANSLGDSFLGEYLPGKQGEVFPEGTGRLLKAGSRVRFRVQYHGAGEQLSDRASIGFVFYPEGFVPKHRVEQLVVQEIEEIDIPRNSLARTEMYYHVLKPIRLVGFQAHMHLRGKGMCMEAIFSDGRRETLSCVNRFDPKWNLVYLYADAATPLLPAGTTIRIAGVHDNTAGNPRNPDPGLWVGWGKRMVDEVAAANLLAVALSEEEFRELEAARSAPTQGAGR